MKFQRQLTLLFSLVVLLSAVSGAFITSWVAGQRDRDYFLNQNAHITESFARQTLLALMLGMGENAKVEAQTTLSFPNVVHVSIYDNRGTRILDEGKPIYWTPQEEHARSPYIGRFVYENNNNWHFVASVFSDSSDHQSHSPFEQNKAASEYLGYVHVVFSKSAFMGLQQKTFIDNLLSILVAAFFLWLILIVFSSRLTRPLNALSQLMKKAQAGEPGIRANTTGPLELRNMAEAFNKMMSVLETRAHQLDNQNIALLQEIEDRKLAETEQKRLQKRLQQAQKMEAIGQLTGGIAHDFNNILASILGYSELTKTLLPEQSEPKLHRYLDEVVTAGERARDLVAQMLAYSRGGHSVPQALQVAELVNEVIKLLSSTLPSSVELTTRFENNLPSIMMDSVQLHQVVMNLCINARDAMGGTGKLRVELKRVSVKTETICTSCHDVFSGDYVELSVSDTGEGIPKQNLGRVFDPFFTTKEVGKGSGMGLSMVHGIVHEHGGHILVDTVSGQGASFRLLFPTSTCTTKGSATRQLNAITSDPYTNATENEVHIMVVDDEPAVAQYLKDLLEHNGYRVTAKTDSSEALSDFKHNPFCFDAVVTDQTMRGLNGDELAKKLFAIRREIPVIMCTGYSDIIDEARASRLGIRKFFNKPVAPDRLLLALQELTHKDESHRQEAANQ